MLFFSFQSSFARPSQTTPSFLFQRGFQVRQSQRQVFVEDCFCCDGFHDDGFHDDVFGIPSLVSPWIEEDPFESFPFTFATPLQRPGATRSTRSIRTQRESYTYIHDPYQREDARLRPETPRPSQRTRNVRRRVEIRNLDDEEEDEAQWHTHTFIGHGTTQPQSSTTSNRNPLLDIDINQNTSHTAQHTTHHTTPPSPSKTVIMAHTEYYTLLGLQPSCTVDDIKRAYRKLAMKYHPDKNSSPEAAEKFKAFSHANECLMDARRRKIYDKHGPEAAGKPQEYGEEGSDLHTHERAQGGAAGGSGGMRTGESDGVPFKFGEGIPVGLSEQRETRWRDPMGDPFAGIGVMPESFFKFGGRSAAAAERESQARAHGQAQPQQGGFDGHCGHGGHASMSEQEPMDDLYRKAEELLRREAQARAQLLQQHVMGGGFGGHPEMGGMAGHPRMADMDPGMNRGGMEDHLGMGHDPRGGMGGCFGGHQHPGMSGDSRRGFGGGMGGGHPRDGDGSMGDGFGGRGGFDDGFGSAGFGGPMCSW